MGTGNITKKDGNLLKIGVTGIFGSGKTTVTEIFAAEGIPVISCDDIVHQLLGKKKISKKIEETFGKDFFKNGSPDRKKIGKLIFSDIDKRRYLENLLHPAVFAELRKRILDYNKKGGIIVIEIPLLFETKSENLFNKIIVVKSTPEKIKERLKEKLEEEDIERIWQNQIPLKQKEKKADYIINNSGPYNETLRQVKQLIVKLTSESELSWKQ